MLLKYKDEAAPFRRVSTMADQYIREYVSTLLKYKDEAVNNFERIKFLVTGRDFYRRDSDDGSVCPYYFGNGYTPLTEDEKVLATYMEGLLQLIRIIHGSVDYSGFRHTNDGVLIDNEYNILVFHTSNANILNRVRGNLYCTACPSEAIQMWSSPNVRKRCGCVNIFKASIFDDLNWANGDAYEVRHGGRLLIDNQKLTPIEFVAKSSLAVRECVLEAMYNVRSLADKFEVICRLLINPLCIKREVSGYVFNINPWLSLNDMCKSLIEQGVLSKIIEREE